MENTVTNKKYEEKKLVDKKNCKKKLFIRKNIKTLIVTKKIFNVKRFQNISLTNKLKKIIV